MAVSNNLVQLEDVVKKMSVDFAKVTGKDPFCNNSLYYVLCKFYENNEDLREGLWETVSEWVSQAKMDFENDNVSGQQVGPVNSLKYGFINEEPQRKEHYNNLLWTFNVIMQEILDSSETDMMQKIKEFYESFKMVTYNHFAFLISKLWTTFHTPQQHDKEKFIKLSPRVKTLSDFKKCVSGPNLKCFVCTSTTIYTVASLKQHFVDVHSLYNYKCDVPGCEVSKPYKRLINLHKKEDHVNSRKRKITQEETNGKGTKVSRRSQQLLMHHDYTTCVQGKAVTASASRNTASNFKNQRRRTRKSMKSLQEELRKYKEALEIAEAKNLKKDMIISELSHHLASKKGPCQVTIEENENSDEPLKIYFRPLLDEKENLEKIEKTPNPCLHLVKADDVLPCGNNNDLTNTRDADVFSDIDQILQYETCEDVVCDMNGNLVNEDELSEFDLP